MERRPGDSVSVWAATDLAEKELGWKAKYNVDDMCKHQWQWASKYPQVSKWGSSQHQSTATFKCLLEMCTNEAFGSHVET